MIEPLLPAPGWSAGRGGSPGSHCRRDIIDGIRYLVHNGCVWRALPADLPHWRTVDGYVRTWQDSGATRRMHDTLREQVRVLAGRGPHPTAAIIDSQTVRAAGRGRMVVKRTFGWIMKHRKCVRDYERLPQHHETYLYWSMIHVIAARLARQQAPAPAAPTPALAQPPSTPAL